MSITKFESVFTRKIKHNTKKRLEAIEHYFLEKHDLEVDFDSNQDNCLAFIMQFIQDEDISDDEVFTEILSILEDRYSIGEPFYIASLQLKDGLEFNQLYQVIDEKVSIGNIQQDSFEFTDIQLFRDETDECAIISCRYIEYYMNPMTDEIEAERPLFSGNLNIKFDYKNKLLVTTKSSYNKAVNKIIDSINGALWGSAIIKQYYAQHKMRSKALEIKYDPLTLLVIKLIFEKLEENEYQVEGVNSLLFYNNGAPRIKNAKLGGVDLFEDSDIIERICNGDRITSVSIKINKSFRTDGSSLQSDLTIDFRGMLKIILNEFVTAEEEKLNTLTYEIFQMINELIINENTSEDGSNIFENDLLPNAFKARTFYDFYINKIESELKEFIPDKESEIEKYFHTERTKR
ncbi:hypothetical protein P5663_02985 [Priestia flexa]|uniref:hypothetical protein n=1 Tax=Priestia flexa TaxID=86664 RepID=UPI00240D6F91|nr:hypothetical protein [Priestia flexa]WEZ08872.1 hypothetical protein P5663_02985 [Priestia flexa]